jgi:hypothetical protein
MQCVVHEESNKPLILMTGYKKVHYSWTILRLIRVQDSLQQLIMSNSLSGVNIGWALQGKVLQFTL